ncbi:hypothetical protein [Vibrio sp. dhg]|jgi:hypothetical protein|uniref:hypothetical protein n=1 Tax=Vibrio sp. dhg TaxID=2163016 RepID=UPI000E4BAA85|nr:hypothetical protein [Vibrio sp. dhg]AXT74181.1 hypothetical protein DBX26_24730 [Vibrio sp. dhg]
MFNFGETYLAVDRLIDSVWTVKFQFQPDGVKILSFSSDNPDGYKLEQTLPKVRIIENDKRIVHAIKVYNPDMPSFERDQDNYLIGEYKVANPQYVFSYTESEVE